MQITATVLTYQRHKNLPVIIGSLKGQTLKPSKIVVLNNGKPITEKIEGVEIMNLDNSFGCIARLLYSMFPVTDYVLTLDDDVALKKDAVKAFAYYAEKNPKSILGFYGVDLNKNPRSRIYWDGNRRYGRKVNEVTKVDVIGGRVCWFRPEFAAKAIFEWCTRLDYPRAESEDILLSLVNRDVDKLLVPCKGECDYIDLDELGVGLSHRSGHKDIRDLSVKKLLDV